MKKLKEFKVVRLTSEQQALKQSCLPKPPADLTEAAKRLFQAALNKVECKPTASGALKFDYSKLTEEESFAIGVSVHDPKNVRDKQIDLWPRRILRDYGGREPIQVFQPNLPDLIAAIARVRETARKQILVTAHGEKFPVSRRSGSLSPIHQYLSGLYKKINPSNFEAFWKAVETEADGRNGVAGDAVTLEEVDGTTLRYVDRKGRHREIDKNTIRNHNNTYKKICS